MASGSPKKSSAKLAVRTRASANVRSPRALAGDTVDGPIVVHEDLLERRLATRETNDILGGERIEQWPHAARDLEAKPVGPCVLDGDPFERLDLGRPPGE